MSDIRYVKGFAKEIKKDGWEHGFINIDINKDDFNSLHVNEHGYVQITVKKRKEDGKFGDTHYMVENDYQRRKEEASRLDGEVPFA